MEVNKNIILLQNHYHHMKWWSKKKSPLPVVKSYSQLRIWERYLSKTFFRCWHIAVRGHHRVVAVYLLTTETWYMIKDAHWFKGINWFTGCRKPFRQAGFRSYRKRATANRALFISELGLEGPILIPVASAKLPGKCQQILCTAVLLVNIWSQLCSYQTLVSALGKTRQPPVIQASLQFSLLLVDLSLLQHRDCESGKCLLNLPLEKD